MIHTILIDYKDFLIAALTGLLTILGALIGGWLSKSSNRKSAIRKELIDCYAAFFIAYAAFTADDSETNKAQVISALEVSRLLFPPKVAASFLLFEEHFIRFPEDTKDRLDLLNQIRNDAADAIGKL